MSSGSIYALTAALLFGLGTPLAKLLLANVPPLMLAALLYLGSGIGLALLRMLLRKTSQLPRGTLSKNFLSERSRDGVVVSIHCHNEYTAPGRCFGPFLAD